MIEIADGFAVRPKSVAVLKRGDAGQCVLFTEGQSALEGFVVDREFEDVLEEINAEESDGDEE